MDSGPMDDFEDAEEDAEDDDDKVPLGAKDLPPGGLGDETVPNKSPKVKDPYEGIMNQMPQLLKECKVEMRDSSCSRRCIG